MVGKMKPGVTHHFKEDAVKKKGETKKRNSQKVTKKEPGELDISRFADLTSAERKLLGVLVDPPTRHQPITEICKRAGISRKAYYQVFDRKAFCDLYEREVRSIYRRDAMAASHALSAGARRGDTICIKLLLELAGFYKPKMGVEHSGSIDTSSESEKEFMDWLKSAASMPKTQREGEEHD